MGLLPRFASSRTVAEGRLGDIVYGSQFRNVVSYRSLFSRARHIRSLKSFSFVARILIVGMVALIYDDGSFEWADAGNEAFLETPLSMFEIPMSGIPANNVKS